MVPSLNILKQRYLKDNDKDWGDIARRVAFRAASVEKTEKDRVMWEDTFFDIINKHHFIPGGRITSEAGYSNQMMNCQVTPVNNSLEQIFNETLISEMRLYSRSGSSGFDFSKLTPRGQKTSRGYAAGPVSFMSLVGKVAKTIYQESSRDPGSMGILRIDHPDILEFIDAKAVPDDLNKKIINTIVNILNDFDLGLSDDKFEKLVRGIERVLIEKYQFPNFNISVAVTDTFIERFYATPNDFVVTEHEGKKQVLKNITYGQLFEKIAEAAWKYGEPGIIFIDTINKYHPLTDEISATNVCGEQPLLEFEGCCLGHLNLTKIYSDVNQDLNSAIPDQIYHTFLSQLQELIPITVRFLDNIIDATVYATEDYERVQKTNRKIGLGVMGFADLLLYLGISYGNNDACADVINDIGSLLKRKSYETSADLAKEKGYNKKTWMKIVQKNKTRENIQPYEKNIRRNTCLNTLAPTGSGALIAKFDADHYTVSSGIEPWFSFRVFRTDETTGDGGALYDWHPLVGRFLNASDGVVNIDKFNKNKPAHFVTALDISPRDHLFVLAEWQKYIDSSISKTINCPENITPEEILQLLLDAHDMECKAFTIYRTNSRQFEVLKDASKKENKKPPLFTTAKSTDKAGTLYSIPRKESTQIIRSISNEARYGITISIPTGHSKLHVTITEDENEIPTEVYCNLGKGGTDEASSTEAMGRVVSSWLQHTYNLEDALRVLRVISEQLHGIGGLKQIHHNGDLVRSIWDGLSRILEDYCDLKDPRTVATTPKKPTALNTNTNIIDTFDMVKCDSCSHVFQSVEKCPVCPKCGNSKCSG